jgi:hypothetical protein
MITKYNTYLLLEKSNLSKYFDNQFVKDFFIKYKFNLTSDSIVKEVEIANLSEELNKLLTTNIYLIIKTNDNDIYVVYLNNDNYFLISKYKDNNFRVVNRETKNDCLITINTIMDIKNLYVIEADKELKSKKNKYKYDFQKLLIIIKEQFENRYSDILSKLYKDLSYIYKKEMYDIMKKYNIYKIDPFLDSKFKIKIDDYIKVNKYLSDLEELNRLIINPFRNINFKREIINIDNDLEFRNIYKFDFFEYVEQEYIDKIIKQLFKEVYNYNNSMLNYKTQELTDKLLSKDITKYKELKYTLFSDEYINKWKHLDNANNFDIL